MEHPNTYNCVKICHKCNEFILEGASKNLPSDSYCGSLPIHIDCEKAIILSIKNSEVETEVEPEVEKKGWKENLRSSFFKFAKRYFGRE